jgi:SpoVK/Ycf46/Vps4 family AAA+-type ATPase
MSDQTAVDYGSSMQHIEALVKAHVPYIWVSSFEEKRFLRTLNAEISDKLEHELWTWSSHGGLIKYEPGVTATRATGDLEKTNMPNIALAYIEQYKIPAGKNGAIFILKDFHTVLAQPIPRQLRDIQDVLIKSKKTLVFLAPCLAHGPGGTKPGLDPTLEKSIVVVPYELPSRDQIEQRLRANITHLQKGTKGKISKTKLDYTSEEYEKFTTALQGLTEQEAEVALTTCLVHMSKLDERKLLREKKQIVQKSEILEYIGQAPSMSDVGGLDAAKKYFDTYSDQFTKEAQAYGVEPLRGVLLTGVPGTGKSLLAKAIAALWNLPLLRLDVGKVMTGLVGGSEEKMRAVISQVEAIAPCVLWIDEIEKSLSGTKSSNFSDGGTLSRVFGTLLTAMEERMQGVVTIATANDIQALPPELIRRFNEVMFVDLPLETEREEIFRIHLRKRGRDADKLDLNMAELVKATHMYTGSEIEKAVKEAIARAFRTKKKDVGQFELLGAVKDTKCIAKVMAEQIQVIRDWARDKARYASSLAAEANAPGKQKVRTKGGKELDLASEIDDLDEVGSDLATDSLLDHDKDKE